jgi:hypothetical protein
MASPCAAPSEERAGRGFGGACFVKPRRRLEPSAARASAQPTQMRGRLSLLTFFGEAKKVSAAAHNRQSLPDRKPQANIVGRG